MSRIILPTILAVLNALWFGGLIVLFIAVSSLFTTFASDHSTAGLAASGIFFRFNRYQLVLAVLSLVVSFAWRICSGRRSVTGLFFGYGLAAFTAIVVSGRIAPKLEAMRLAQQTHTPEFLKLHGISMALYLFETVCVLLCTLALPLIIRRSAQITAAR